MKGDLLEKYGNVRSLGFVLFILASVFCLYKIYDLSGQPSDAYRRPTFTSQLKLVSVLGRHGDRAPSDALPKGDRHADKIKFFWPNGMSNLTESGQQRQFRVGLELRQRYGDLLSYNASHYLAFSSPINRCQESLSWTLRGLFDIEWTSGMGRRLVNMYNADRSGSRQLKPGANRTSALALPSGSGSPDEYKNVTIDLDTVPVLTWEYLDNKCTYRREHPSSVDKDLMASRAIKELKGVRSLSDLLRRHYELAFNFSALPHWATIDDELRLARTRESIAYGDHYANWVNERPPEYNKASKVTFFDLYEQLAVLGYRDRIEGTADYIQVGPILTSIVQSQRAALNQTTGLGRAGTARFSDTENNNNNNNKGFDSIDLYKDKRAIFYSTHDSILLLVMHRLNMTYIDSGDFEARFNKWRNSDDVSKFLAGFKMPEFGASLAFELHEMEMKEKHAGALRSVKKFAYVQAALYNQEDGKYQPVEYKRLKLGAMCRQKFERNHKGTKRGRVSHLLDEKFYDDDFPLDRDLSCPFELFKNITADYMIEPQQLASLCAQK